MTFKVLLSLVLFIGSLGTPCEAADTAKAHRVIYLARQNKISEAIDLYREHTKTTGRADYELLQDLGLCLLEMGFASSDPETQLLAVYGAGISAHDYAAGILASGLLSPVPQIQLASLELLSRLGNDEADTIIFRATSSDQLLIRLTALYYLTERKHPLAIGQVEALYHKIIPELQVLFPQFFALSGDPRAIKQLRRMLHHPNQDVRVETILSIGLRQRDDLLPQIRMMLTHPNTKEQEACASVIGKMDDQTSLPKLKVLAKSKAIEVQLAACEALYRLGEHAVVRDVEKGAKTGNSYAIALLAQMEGGEDTLASLISHENLQVRCNAALALLQRRDPRCLKGLREVLIKDARDLAFVSTSSRGRALTAWKVVPSASHVFADTPVALELSTSLREKALAACLELPQEAFLEIAEWILKGHQSDLIPAAVELLEISGSTEAVNLLKKYQQTVGAPLVRNYCTLGLFKMSEPGPYAHRLKQWLTEQQDIDMIQFRPFVPLDLREHVACKHSLTPQESSRLFIAAVEALGNKHDEQGLSVLLDLIRNGNPKNRCALAGLLMRASQ